MHHGFLGEEGGWLPSSPVNYFLTSSITKMLLLLTLFLWKSESGSQCSNWLLRQRLVYLKVLRVCDVTPSWLIIYEKWDIFWSNTKLAKHGSSIIQSRKTAVLKYILSCWDFSCLFSFNENNILWKEMNTESVLVTCWWRQNGSSQISSRWRNYGFL